MEKKTVGTIIVLFVVALLLGAIIFGQQGGQQPPFVSEPDATAPDGGPPAQAPVTQGSSARPNAVAVLMFPEQNASKEERDRHGALVDSLAQKAPYLDLTGCVPNPLVVLRQKGESLMVKNTDTARGYILQWGPNRVAIPEGKTITVSAEKFGSDAGTIGYACYAAGIKDPLVRTVGIIHTR